MLVFLYCTIIDLADCLDAVFHSARVLTRLWCEGKVIGSGDEASSVEVFKLKVTPLNKM